jgi:hypothetical protein
MHARWSVALLLFAYASTAFAQADLQTFSSASPTEGLQLGQDVLVSTTVRNNGPNAAPAGSAGVSGESQESFFFQLIGSETPGCVFEQLDFSPPLFNYHWSLPGLAVDEEYTCVARLRVVILPVDNTAQLFAGVISSGGLVDPVPGNNNVTLDFLFGTFVSTSHHTIPSTSIWGEAWLALGVLMLALVASNRRRA